MTSEFEYSQIANQEDIARLGNILEQCFLMSPGESEIFFNRLGLENFRIIRQAYIPQVGGLRNSI